MRHLIAAAFGGSKTWGLSQESALLCGGLGQKAYIGLEMAELAWQTQNIVGLAIASRTLVETAAMFCALVDDPGQAEKMLSNPTAHGLSRLDRLKNGEPAIAKESLDLAMSLAHQASN